MPKPGDQRKAILERAERERVKFLRLQFTDILGVIKNVEVPDRQFGEALDGKIMFDGSSIEGFVRIEESDMYLRPDLATFQVFPWTDATRRARRAASSATSLNPDGSPFAGCPRTTLEERDRPGGRARLHDDGRARGGVLPVPAPRRPAHDRDARLGRLLRPGARRPGRGRAPRDRPRARADGLRGRGGPPRGGARASTRSTSGTTTC